MKIAVFYELDVGGARRSANEFSKAMKRLGHQVDLYYIDSRKSSSEQEYYTNTHFYAFSPIQWSGGNWLARLYRDTIELFLLYKLHKKIAFDIQQGRYAFTFVHPSKFTQAPFMLYILHRLNIPSFYYCQEPLRIVYDRVFYMPTTIPWIKKVYERLSRRIRKMIDKTNISCADLIFTNSNFTQLNISQAYKLASTVCHMGVDHKRFFPSAKKSIDILFVGSRDVFDGFPLFEESVAYMKKKPKILYLIRGENWTKNDKQLRDAYSRARIVICFGYNEPFGLIPLEAMACGSVVVALNEGGYTDSVRHNVTGILVKKDPLRIAKVLESLLGNHKKLERLSSTALTRVKEYWNWKRGARMIVERYEEVSILHS